MLQVDQVIWLGKPCSSAGKVSVNHAAIQLDKIYLDSNNNDANTMLLRSYNDNGNTTGDLYSESSGDDSLSFKEQLMTAQVSLGNGNSPC